MASDDATAGPVQPVQKRGRRRYRLLAVLLGLVAAFLIAEIAVRAAGLGELQIASRALMDSHNRKVRYHCYPSNPHGEFSPVPDVFPGRHRLFRYLAPPEEIDVTRISETPWCVRYSLPSEGLRGPEIRARPARGVERIMVVGDSFVFGDGVPEDKTLSAQIGNDLGAAHEVINCGRAGASLGGYVEILEQVLPLYSPSRVIVVCIPNDIHRTDEIGSAINPLHDLVIVRPEYVHGDETPPWWARASRLLAAVHESWRIRQVARRTLGAYLDAHDPATNPGGLEEARETFATLREIRDREDLPIAVVVYPLMYLPGGEYPLGPAHERLVALAEEAGLPVLDLADAFSDLDHDDLRVHPVDHHPNGHAHGIAARAITTWLRETVPGFLSGD